MAATIIGYIGCTSTAIELFTAYQLRNVNRGDRYASDLAMNIMRITLIATAIITVICLSIGVGFPVADAICSLLSIGPGAFNWITRLVTTGGLLWYLGSVHTKIVTTHMELSSNSGYQYNRSNW